ncbi:MAG: hypothetical protein U5L11_12625 [Arhodomonas sp.]|nr:hypothetical protein [Arhodomonas sp.]
MDRGNVSVTLLTERLGPGLPADSGHGGEPRRSPGVLGVLAWRLARQAMRLSSYGDTTMFLSIPLGPVAWGMAVLTGARSAADARQRARHRQGPNGSGRAVEGKNRSIGCQALPPSSGSSCSACPSPSP